MKTPQGVPTYTPEESLERYLLTNSTIQRLMNEGYQLIEVPLLQMKDFYDPVVEGTENRIFEVGDQYTLLPEATKYLSEYLKKHHYKGAFCYQTKCFRNETTTDSNRKREFTQVGVEVVQEDTWEAFMRAHSTCLNLFKNWFEKGWRKVEPDERGVNLYNGATFEIHSGDLQLAGGGEYENGAGFAIGIERVVNLRSQ